MAKILVTGGAGFIGSHVVDDLISIGHEVVALDDLSGGFTDNVNAKAEFVQGTVTDVTLINSLFEKHKFEYVFHLAAYAAEGLSHFIRRFNYTNNLIGSINVINACVNHKVKCLVFTSSIAAYGKNQLPMTESLVPQPEDPYGISKYAIELDLKAAHEMWGLNYIIFRPHNVYGEKQNSGDKYRNVLGIFMNQILQGKELTIFGDGEQTRAFTYIRDISPLIAKSVFNEKAYNQVFNVGSDKPYTVNHIAKVICAEMGVEPKLNHQPARNEVVHAYSDHKKLFEYFGEIKFTPLEVGIHNMVEHVKKVGVRESKDFDNIEIEEKMPPSWVRKS